MLLPHPIPAECIPQAIIRVARQPSLLVHPQIAAPIIAAILACLPQFIAYLPSFSPSFWCGMRQPLRKNIAAKAVSTYIQAKPVAYIRRYPKGHPKCLTKPMQPQQQPQPVSVAIKPSPIVNAPPRSTSFLLYRREENLYRCCWPKDR